MEKILGQNVIKLVNPAQYNYIPWVKNLATFSGMTDEQLKLWNEYRNFTSHVIATMFQDELLAWEDWPGLEFQPDNSNPRFFEYKVLEGPMPIDIDKMQYLIDVYNVTNKAIKARIDDDFPIKITFFTHNLIYEGRHIKVKNVDAKEMLYTVTIDPEKEV